MVDRSPVSRFLSFFFYKNIEYPKLTEFDIIS